jgi:hypothetical protein
MADSSYDENKDGTVLKTDVLGRVKTSARQREAMLDEFERSGLSATKFAAVAGVNYQTFASWVQKRRKAVGRPELHARNNAPSFRPSSSPAPNSVIPKNTMAHTPKAEAM